ncbi:MAG: citrate synthase [Gammaproteobacteria bacterium]|jgi:citrate synthase|nr:citrate synthase [Gammaproteobacteria bacterium]MBT5406527.1 citrate synthase [Gammaproteobacteria bacterium]MBT7322611.1 citrate synthase [Gammaproteobacteria bacterium]
MTDYHPGLDGVIATESSISDIDGDKGVLSYRGYSIEELAEKSTFEETAYLLLTGELPTKTELKDFTAKINSRRDLPEGLIELLKTLPKDSNPMDVIQLAVSSLGTFYPVKFDAEELKANKYTTEYYIDISAGIIGSIGSIVAAWNRIKNNKAYIKPDDKLSYAENFMHMLDDSIKVTPLINRIIDATLILHAEHTINASTFTAMVTSSTLASPTQVIASAIGSLSGPLHGGANQKVILMLNEMGGKENAKAWLDERLSKKQVVWGMGHREYSTKDPRANILTGMVKDLFKEQSGKVSEMFETAMALEEACEERLSKKGVYANVDFYSGILYKEIGIPVDLFTSLFAISRTSGWLAHWIEQVGNNKIFRPTQSYKGYGNREYSENS